MNGPTAMIGFGWFSQSRLKPPGGSRKEDDTDQEVDRAVGRVEHVPPDRGHDDLGDHHREDQDRPVEALQAQALRVKDQGHDHAQHDVDHDVRERPEEIEDQDPREVEVGDDDVVVEDPPVVGQADVVRRGRRRSQVREPVVGERHPDLEDQRVERDDGHHDEGGKQEHVGGPGVLAASPSDRRGVGAVAAIAVIGLSRALPSSPPARCRGSEGTPVTRRPFDRYAEITRARWPCSWQRTRRRLPGSGRSPCR